MKICPIVKIRCDTYLVSILSSFTKPVTFTYVDKKKARLRCAYVWPGSARRAKFRAVTLRRDDNVAWWGSYSPRPRWNNALSSNIVYYRSRGVERVWNIYIYIYMLRERKGELGRGEWEKERRNRETEWGGGGFREQRDARGFEHFEGLSRAWRTHIVCFYTRSAVETLRSSDQIGSTERVRSIGLTATAQIHRQPRNIPWPQSAPPPTILFHPRFSSSLPPREPRRPYLFVVRWNVDRCPVALRDSA